MNYRWDARTEGQFEEAIANYKLECISWFVVTAIAAIAALLWMNLSSTSVRLHQVIIGVHWVIVMVGFYQLHRKYRWRKHLINLLIANRQLPRRQSTDDDATSLSTL